MPGFAVGTAPLAGWARGFFGKLPAHGDFVQSGLPRGFVAAWDGWMARVLPASRERLGEAWLDAWLEAPVWRFALPAGVCGAQPAVGAWMPSVDAVGRHFPLVLAACGDGEAGWEEIEAFLDAAAAAGLSALERDAPADDLAAALYRAAPPPLPSQLGGGAGDLSRNAGEVVESASETGGAKPPTARWWTDGAPLVRACVRETAELPDEEGFAAMLRDEAQP